MKKYLIMGLVILLWTILLVPLLSYALEQHKTYAIDSTLKGQITRIVVNKSKRELIIYHDEAPLKTYPILLGKNPIGHKQFEGDKKTPEGKYFIDSKNPKSKFYLNLGISYPNEADK